MQPLIDRNQLGWAEGTAMAAAPIGETLSSRWICRQRSSCSVRRGLETSTSLDALLRDQTLPAAHDHFPELQAALQRLKTACHDHEPIAICGVTTPMA